MDKHYIPTVQELVTHVIEGENIYAILVDIQDDKPVYSGQVLEVENSPTIQQLDLFLKLACSINPEGKAVHLPKHLYRIKYLDGDGIMSLGFEIANDEGNTYKSLKKQRGLGTGDDKTLFVYHDVFENNRKEVIIKTHIWWRENRGDEITVFEGSIKNMLEFKKILEQIHASNIITKEQ